MSFQAYRYVGELRGLTPTEKLVAFQLADFHNNNTNRAIATVQRIASYTGMSAMQIKRALKSLMKRGILAHGQAGFSFPCISDNEHGVPIPHDWKPHPETVAQIVRDFPLHHFNPDEAVNDFIDYAKRTGIRSADFNTAFLRNISAILEHRQPGEVSFQSQGEGAQNTSVRSLMSGRR